jgi:polyvinyl alcohol dehydrogenase (cytochrome)
VALSFDLRKSWLMVVRVNVVFALVLLLAYRLPARQQTASILSRPAQAHSVPGAGEEPQNSLLGPDQTANRCPDTVKSAPVNSPAWTNWGENPANWRFQPAARAGISAASVPKLKLKWAFGMVKFARSQPAVFRGRVFVGGYDGTVYALDARTGCTVWAKTTKPVRSGIAISKSSSLDAVFFGDESGGVTALNAASGKLLWIAHPEDHPWATITGTPSYYDGRVYVPMSSHEEQARSRPGYECCTFRGSVTALDAVTGHIIWKTYMAVESPTPRGKKPDGSAIIGPSGMGVWSSPTVDVAKQRIYVGTADKYSEPKTPAAAAAVALDLKTGKILWSTQCTKENIYKIECGSPPAAGCAEPIVTNFDISAPPILVALPSGKRVLLLGQKSALVYALDPDAKGKFLWYQRAGLLGGVHRGMATDGSTLYVAVSDLAFLNDSPDPTKGGGISAYRISDGKLLWKTLPPGCGARRPCSPAQSQAISSIPGAIFSGSIDGHLRAYAAKDGSIIWDCDTARSFDSVNGIPATGGSLDVGGPIIAAGMVFVISGYPEFGAMRGNAFLAFAVE